MQTIGLAIGLTEGRMSPMSKSSLIVTGAIQRGHNLPALSAAKTTTRSPCITLFDAKSGYWQIPMAEEDQWKTAFIRHDGMYELTRMPFGLMNAWDGLHL